MRPDVASLPALPAGDTGSIGAQPPPLLPPWDRWDAGVTGAIIWGQGSQYMHWGWVFLPKTIPCCFSGVRRWVLGCRTPGCPPALLAKTLPTVPLA